MIICNLRHDVNNSRNKSCDSHSETAGNNINSTCRISYEVQK